MTINTKLYATLIALLSVLGLQACRQDKDLDPADESVTVETFLPANLGIGLAVDAADNLYIADPNKQIIRRVTPAKEISVFAGTGEVGLVDGKASSASFYFPNAMTFDGLGNLYVAQKWAVRKITPSGIVSTIAGKAPSWLNSTHPDSALFGDSPSLLVDRSGNLLVADNSYYRRILKITPQQTISALLGRPFGPSQQSGQYSSAEPVNYPKGLAFDSKGNLFIADHIYGILKMTPQGRITRFAGGGTRGHEDGPGTTALFGEINCLAIDKRDNLYVGDDRYLRKISPDGIVSTVTGDGIGREAQFTIPYSLVFDSKGNLFVGNMAGILKITFN
ncbi:hypothetical protein [Spirosoma sp. KUDC1026]|uniref:NHL domain-containing protein n=1 Tax=Spirosoma sp. KUDC1026 TaxID=2745947 RepID=UPI00159BBB37|nr:hypothetical protein [Spirosoma sp. KUDC1026]QKZ12310.1 hypothetical protein HU175_06585 [Spirosoma sp. KUDC1026]